MPQVTVHRSDYGGTQDSDHTPYFHYLLSQLGVPEEDQPYVEDITFRVEPGYTTSPDNKQELTEQ